MSADLHTNRFINGTIAITDLHRTCYVKYSNKDSLLSDILFKIYNIYIVVRLSMKIMFNLFRNIRYVYE